MMDVLVAATAFGTIVQLLSIFKQERSKSKEQTSQEFIVWLDAHRHQEIKNMILRSASLIVEIDKILHDDHVRIMSQLRDIDCILATIASRIESFSGLVQILNPEAVLSEQALSFLTALVHSEAQEIAKIGYIGGVYLELVPKGGKIDLHEPRFVDDDLNTLVSFGLLLHRTGAHGSTFYGITRNAIRLVRMIKQQTQNKPLGDAS
jgi:hypothetical protein